MIKPFIKDRIPDDFPYKKCIDCESMGVDCDGPNILNLAKDITLFRDWCIYRLSFLHSIDPSWTMKRVADEAYLSRRSIDRLFSDDPGDPRTSTMCEVSKVLIGSSEKCNTCCAMDDYVSLASKEIVDLEEHLTAVEEENKVLQRSAEAMGEEYRLNIALYEKEKNEETESLRLQIKELSAGLHEAENELRHKTELLEREMVASKNLRRYLRWVAMFAIAMAVLFVLYFILFDLTSRSRGLVQW